ncbi:type IVB secretion system protein IcmH/DotU [Geomonas sp. Red32]|uniref:type IVB secretion system protein IcmH/DotU n=1 Tax=Geomonas sp. Red32 TaxID=2912856 RepID=UPI00202CACF2|nr:type IVB secretion system protein IcmH/DotU [Geomonas sp. Red32]MCM0082090.1 type IVB secretion system protein IcmH/DotU [Geomonas sp. Red32]
MALSVSFIPLFTYAAALHGSLALAQPAQDAVRDEVDRLLAQAEAAALATGAAREDVALSRFAVCALIDEFLAKSAWLHKQAWLSDQLQRRHFNTTEAGEEFFQRLTALGRDRIDAREVYYLCLCLGFQGRYCQVGGERELDRLKRENLALLSPDKGAAGARLFPEAYQSGAASGLGREGGGSKLSPVVLISLFAPLLVLGTLYVVYRLSLATLTEHVLKSVGS